MRTFTILGLTALCASAASAAPGDHIQAGPVEVIPSVALGFEAWSNAYLARGNRNRDDAVARDAERLGVNFYLSPAMTLKLDTRKVRLSLHGEYMLRKFLQPEIAADLDRFSDFRAGFRLDVLPQSVVGVYLADDASMANRARPVPNFDGSLLRRFRNVLEGGLVVRPGAGVELTPGVAWSYQNVVLPSLGGPTMFNNRSTISPKVDLNWRFFPNTMFVVEARYDQNKWANNWIESNGGALGDFIGLPDSQAVKAQTGIRGRFTRVLVLSLTAGYGFADYNEDSVAEEGGGHPEVDPDGEGYGQNVGAVDGILATVQVGLDFGHSEKKTFGQMVTARYLKDFDDSFFTNYVAFNDLSLRLNSRWGKFLGTELEGGVRFESYVGEVDRSDTFLTAGGHLQVIPAKWVDIKLGAKWFQRASEDANVEFDNVIGSLVATFTY